MFPGLHRPHQPVDRLQPGQQHRPHPGTQLVDLSIAVEAPALLLHQNLELGQTHHGLGGGIVGGDLEPRELCGEVTVRPAGVSPLAV